MTSTTGLSQLRSSGRGVGGGEHAYLRVLGAEVQGLQEERGELGLVGGELLLPHHPDVLAQDAHKWAHEILKTQSRDTPVVNIPLVH